MRRGPFCAAAPAALLCFCSSACFCTRDRGFGSFLCRVRSFSAIASCRPKCRIPSGQQRVPPRFEPCGDPERRTPPFRDLHGMSTSRSEVAAHQGGRFEFRCGDPSISKPGDVNYAAPVPSVRRARSTAYWVRRRPAPWPKILAAMRAGRHRAPEDHDRLAEDHDPAEFLSMTLEPQALAP